MKAEAEAGVPQPRPGVPGAPEAGRGRKDPPLGLWGVGERQGPMETLITDSWPPEMKKRYLCCFSHSVCGHLLWQPQETNHYMSLRTGPHCAFSRTGLPYAITDVTKINLLTWGERQAQRGPNCVGLIAHSAESGTA